MRRVLEVLPNSSRRHHTARGRLLGPESSAEADFETGDFVILGRLEVNFSLNDLGGGATGVVSEVTPVDCLVAVLDPSGSFKVGEQHASPPCKTYNMIHFRLLRPFPRG